MDQVVIGNRIMKELAFFHRASRTLVLTDLVENFHDETPGTNAMLKVWRRLFGMWGKPRPAPELRMFTWDRAGTRRALERILSWNFDRAVISHGELLDWNAHQTIRAAWKWAYG